MASYDFGTCEEMAVKADRYTVHCEGDPNAGVWVATSDDVPGLATGADTLDELIEKLKVVISELREANGLLKLDQRGDIPYAIIASREGTACRVNGGELHAGGREAVARRRVPGFERQGKGGHEIWTAPVTKRRFMVDARIKSRHWTNYTMKRAGLPQAF